MIKKTKVDPTGQAGNRNKSARTLGARLASAEKKIRALFNAIPRQRRRITKVQNAETETVYDYEFTAADLEQLSLSIGFILNDELLETQSGHVPFGWYWGKEIEKPYRQGTLEEVRDFNLLVFGAITAGTLVNGMPPAPVPPEQLLLSEPYHSGLNAVKVSGFNDIKSLSDKTAAQVIRRINTGINAGAKPSLIANDISTRFNVAQSDAKRISNTEINKVFNNAKLDTTRLLGVRTGLRAAVVHISALSTTTRAGHADRHGNAYTVTDQLTWWDQGANRINCKCSTRSVLIDKAGKVIDTDSQEKIKAEKSFFD